MKSFLMFLCILVSMFTVSDCQGKDCTNHKCHPFTECHLSKTEDDRIIPVCIKVPSCATKQCDFGEKCLMKPVKCQLTPCFKVPICLPDVNEASPEYQMPPALLV
ncbi:unnamed protein product [Caenorhabditis brenneri]